jgi:hypothetical protein
MAITIPNTSTRSISVEEFLDWAHDNVDPSDDDSVMAASSRLAELNNNKSFVIEKINAEISSLAEGRPPEYESAQGTIHGQRISKWGQLFVRTVIWTPPLSNDPRARALQDFTLSFVTPHNHNFALLTAGYFGPGYTTEIYECDPENIEGYAGEDIELRYLETTKLEENKLLYFRPFKDVHAQLHPESVSISLNLIAQVPHIHLTEQYEFDSRQKKIVGLLKGNPVPSLLTPFKILSLLGGDERSVDLVEEIMRKHVNPHVRSRALVTLASMVPEEKPTISRVMSADASHLVQSTLREVMAEEQAV